MEAIKINRRYCGENCGEKYRWFGDRFGEKFDENPDHKGLLKKLCDPASLNYAGLKNEFGWKRLLERRCKV
jgi:hypothetical protein